jgi:hypothetical protein
VCLSVALLAGPAVTAQTRSFPRSKVVFVSALDRQGTPVVDLTAADFQVKENGQRRELVRAELARVPLAIDVLVDDTGVASAALARAVSAFVASLDGQADVSVQTQTRRSTRDNALDSADAPTAVTRDPYSPGPDAPHLFDRLLRASQGFLRRQAARPVIVAIGPAPDAGDPARVEAVAHALAASGTQLYLFTLAIGPRTAGPSTRAGGQSLAAMMEQRMGPDDASERTGGRTVNVLSAAGLTEALDRLSAELTTQYLIEYRAPIGSADARLSIDVQRKGIRLRAPRRVG